MEDPRKVVLENILPRKCRITNTKSPVVLLCGGPVPAIKTLTDDSDPIITSLRHAIHTQFTKYELFLPEEITTWNDDSIFNNLVDFETELAAICSLVVIILESPGSIAELGTFSQLHDLKEKLLVIKSSYFNKDELKNSFINLGILRYLKESNENSVKIFSWDINNPRCIDKDTIHDVVSGIQVNLSSINNTEILNNEHISHATTVVCDLIRLFVALKQAEIIKYAKYLEFPIETKTLKRKLFLLERFNFIKPFEYDGAKYYCSINDGYNKLRLAFDQNKHIDSTMIPAQCLSYYKHIKDRHRLGAIKDYQRESLS